MASLVLHSTLTSPLLFPFYSSSSDTYHIHLHIFLYFLSFLATNNFLSLALLFSIFLHVQLLVYHDAAKLFLFSTLHPLVCTLFLPSTPILPLSAIHIFTILLLSSSSSLLLAFFIFSTISTSGPSSTTLAKLQIQ